MNENAALEKSIREEAEKNLRTVEDRLAVEIRKLDEANLLEIENFRKTKVAETEEKIEQEKSKIASRAALDRKKLKLGFIEAFISRIVDEAVKAMRNDAHYKKFLIDTIPETIGQIREKAVIFLKPEDLVFKKDIEDAMKQGKNSDILIKEDSTIKWGGCIIHDQQGRIFNSTIERIYFRKSPVIRQEVMNILKQKWFID